MKPVKCKKCYDKGFSSIAFGSARPNNYRIVKKFCTCAKGKLMGKGKRYE